MLHIAVRRPRHAPVGCVPAHTAAPPRPRRTRPRAAALRVRAPPRSALPRLLSPLFLPRVLPRVFPRVSLHPRLGWRFRYPWRVESSDRHQLLVSCMPKGRRMRNLL